MSAEIFDAINQHDVARLRSVLARGANPNEYLDRPPYWHALEAAIEEVERDAPIELVLHMLTLLITHGADVNAWDPEHDVTPLLKSLYFPVVGPNETRPTDIIRLLLESGADTNVENSDGLTPLKYAVSRLDTGLVSEMLEHGAARTIDKVGGWSGCNALHLAATDLAVAIMRLLLDAGANPAVPDVDGRTALHRLPARNPTNQQAWNEAYELLTPHHTA